MKNSEHTHLKASETPHFFIYRCGDRPLERPDWRCHICGKTEDDVIHIHFSGRAA